MKLVVNCEGCRERIIFHDSSNDRVELENEKGTMVKLSCKSCLKTSNYHVNEITAEVRKPISIIAFLVLVIGTVCGFWILNNYLESNRLLSSKVTLGLLVVPSLIYGILNKQESDNVERFNSYKI